MSVVENIQLSLLVNSIQALSLGLVGSRDRLLLVAFIKYIVLQYCPMSFVQRDEEGSLKSLSFLYVIRVCKDFCDLRNAVVSRGAYARGQEGQEVPFMLNSFHFSYLVKGHFQHIFASFQPPPPVRADSELEDSQRAVKLGKLRVL